MQFFQAAVKLTNHMLKRQQNNRSSSCSQTAHLSCLNILNVGIELDFVSLVEHIVDVRNVATLRLVNDLFLATRVALSCSCCASFLLYLVFNVILHLCIPLLLVLLDSLLERNLVQDVCL